MPRRKKYRLYVNSKTSKCHMHKTFSKKMSCPNCGEEDTFNIIRRRHGYCECRICGEEYTTGECFDECFD